MSTFDKYIKPTCSKRDRAIEEIDKVLTEAQDYEEPMSEFLYKAGYRKVNELTDEDVGKCTDEFQEAAKWARDFIMGEGK